MTTKPLNDEQIADAKRLFALFASWQERRRLIRLPASQEVASEFLGFGQSALSQYITGRIPLNPMAATKFASLLACEVSAFSPSIAAEIEKMRAAASTESQEGLRVRTTDVAPGGAIQTDRLAVGGLITMKVGGWFDAVQPGSGSVEISRSDDSAYVWRVRGDGAYPVVRDGWSVVVSSKREPQSADFVVLKLRDGRYRLAELLFTRDDGVTISDIAGSAERLSIDRTDIEFLHPVINIIPSSGWQPD